MTALALRLRLRLFFKGAVKELALIATLQRDHRTYRDGMNHLVAALVDDGMNHLVAALVALSGPTPNTLYVMIDSAHLLRIIQRVYGPDHPWAIKLVEFRRQFPGLEEPEVRAAN